MRIGTPPQQAHAPDNPVGQLLSGAALLLCALAQPTQATPQHGCCGVATLHYPILPNASEWRACAALRSAQKAKAADLERKLCGRARALGLLQARLRGSPVALPRLHLHPQLLHKSVACTAHTHTGRVCSLPFTTHARPPSCCSDGF